MSEMLDAALRYADNGWPVFPLIANGKTPATGHGFKDASTDESRIREWFGNGRRCNLGIATGNGLVVIDVDVKGGVDGFATLARIESEMGPLGDTRTAATPSGGRHLYFATTEQVTSSAGALGPGLDVRGEGGYVVAPPSTINGSPYTWEDDLPMRPLAAAVRIRQARSATEDFHELDGEPVPIGQQEDVLNRRACALRRGGVSRAAAVAGLWADVQTWQQERTRPWTLADVELKVERAWRDIEPKPQPVPAAPVEIATPDAGPRVFSIAEARLHSKDSLEYLPVLGADGYIVKAWSHLLAGWWRLGKSELMAATVLPWLRAGLRVVWLTEEPDSIWADRADTCDEIYAAVPWENLILIDAMSATPAELLDKAASIECDVVIVDTIREVCGIGAMKNDDEIRSAVSPWVRRLRGRTLIFIAQHRKSAGERGERVEGSVALPSMMDVVLELEAVDGHDRQRRLTVRRRRAQTAPLTVEMDDDDRIVVVPDARSRGRVETEAAVLFAVNASTGPLTTGEVRSGMSPKPSRDTVHRALIALAEAGTILREPPIAEAARRRTVKWQSAAAAQLDLPQNSIPPYVEFGAEDGVAEDGGVSDAFQRPSP
jgi:Bifunctional DNA primase/polymerase, N-terminal